MSNTKPRGPSKKRQQEILKLQINERTDVSLLTKRPVFGDKVLINTLKATDDEYAKNHERFRLNKPQV
jgi:hypothetical protein